MDPSYEYHALVRGPDGFIWTYLKDVLVRIDPKDAGVHVVGRIDPVLNADGIDFRIGGAERNWRRRRR